MIDLICRKINQDLVEKNIIEFEDYSIYMYGLQLFVATLVKGIGIFTIAYALGWLKEVSIFIVAFSILRVNAGGYHSSTYLKCFMITVLAMIISIAIAKYISIYYSISVAVSFLGISILLIFQYAPVDTPNKPLSSNEYITYRRRSIIIVVLESLVVISVYILRQDLIMYCNIAIISILLESLTLLPFISKKICKRKKLENNKEV